MYVLSIGSNGSTPGSSLTSHDKLPGSTVLVYFGLTYYNFKSTGPVTFTSDIVDIHIIEPAEEINDPRKRRNEGIETGPMFPSPKKCRFNENVE
ncbi:hypothetical protein M407DRAFT_35053 [Tulasnella calospora MUT 4182]|uniref:Uncharacterized protein n=1 Tax=Tulasnella calospora MUT 4182 TaxID=1051891 RepID=A0A0C3L0Y9_9AGAM|nr:hypothetical protein M407DRAFT_35053 [Tulasnella calospora MUT 4182]